MNAWRIKDMPMRDSTILHCTVVFIAAMAVYLWSMPRTVVINDDDGFFIIAAYLNVYAHPPGYPLYSLLGYLATLVPLGSVAFRVHVLTAVFGSLACSMQWLLARTVLGNKRLAWLASLGLAFSAVFWERSTLAKVYSLNTLLFLAIFLLVQRYAATGRTRLLCWSAFFYGLSLSNHWPLLLLSSPALLLLLWPVREKFVRDIRYALPCLLAGLIPYIWMVYRSFAVPELNFDGPFNTWPGFWEFISRTHYEHMDINPGAGWTDRMHFILYTLQLTFTQYGYLGGLFILPGFILQWRVWPRHLCLALLLGYLGSTLALVFLLKFDFDYYHRLIFQVYPHIPFALSGLWLALGCGSFIAWLTRRFTGVRPGLLACALIGLILTGEFAQNAPANYRAHDRYAEDYARAVLETLPHGAILYANANTINGPVGYLTKVLGVRPDVDLYSGHNMEVDGRFERLYKHNATETRKLVDDFLRGTSRPVFYTNDFPHSCKADDYGLYFYVDDSDCHGQQHIYLRKPIITYFRRLLLQPVPRDPWERMHALLLRADYCRLLVNSLPAGDVSKSIESNDELALTCSHYHGLLLLIENLSGREQPDWVFLESLFARAETLSMDEAFTKADGARLDYLKGEMWAGRQDRQQAEAAYRRAWDAWRSPENPALVHLNLP